MGPALAPLPPRSEMERAFLASDPTYNGLFFAAVRSTGIFCVPACPARKPLPQNIEFFATAKEALLAGYRPCKRCCPMESSAPAWVRSLVGMVDQNQGARIREYLVKTDAKQIPIAERRAAERVKEIETIRANLPGL